MDRRLIAGVALALTMWACGGAPTDNASEPSNPPTPTAATSTAAATATTTVPTASAAATPTTSDAGVDLSAVVLSTRTCHDRNAAGGNSDLDLTLDTLLDEGTVVLASITVTNPADGAPAERPAEGVVDDLGLVVLTFPVFAPGETGTLDAAFVAESVALELTGDASFTVEPLPGTPCGPVG